MYAESTVVCYFFPPTEVKCHSQT